MDLILGRFSDAGLERLSPDLLEALELLLSENDHDLYRWITAGGAPARYEAIVARIRADCGIG